MSNRLFRTAGIAGVAALSLLAAACSSSTKSASPGSTTAASAAVSASSSASLPAPTGTITVLAASSLTDTFNKIATQFMALYPGTTVKISYGASSTLATQITQGAPADVFASAAVSNMTTVVNAGAAFQPTNFVKNVMEIAVPPSNPKNITTVADLAKSGVKVALCQPQVPCGATAAQVFTNAKVTVTPVTLQPDVKSTLTQVQSGEVDAGVVYVTDVLAAGTAVKGVMIPDNINATTVYPVAVLTKAANIGGASAFVRYVLSADGQAVMTAGGFQKP